VKVTDGSFDPGRYRLSPEALDAIKRNWAETMGADFGLESYDDLVDIFRRGSV
jgi:hypothetical protein